MNQGQNDVEVGFSANLEGLSRGFADAAGVVRDGANVMGSSTAVAGAAMGVVSGITTELTSRLIDGLGSALREATQRFSDLTKEVEGFRAATGSSIQEASVMIDALGDIGIKSSTYEQIVRRTSMALRTKEEAFERLGVKIKDTSGAYLPMNDIIKNGVERLQSYKEGTDRNAASMELFRMSWKQLEPLLRLTPEPMQDNAEAAEQFGMIITNTDVKAMHDLQLATADAKKPLEGIGVTIGRTLNPLMIELAGILQGLLTGAFYVVTGTIKGMVTFLELLQNGLYVVTESIIGMGRVVGSVFGKLWDALNSESPAEALGNLKNAFSGTEAAVKQTMDNIVKHNQDTKDRIANMWGVGDDLAAPPKGTETYVKKEKKGKEGKAEKDTGAADYMKQLQEEWAEKKLIYENENDLRKMTKAQEADYWESSLKYMAKMEDSEKQLHTIRQKIKILRLEDTNQDLQNQQKIAKINEDGEVAAAKNSIALEKETLGLKAELGLISKAEELRQLEVFEQRAYEIELASRNRELADLQHKPVEYAAMLRRIEQLQAEHNLKMRQLANKEKVESTKIWSDLFSGITNSFKNVAVGLATGTLTIRKAFTALTTGILGEFVSMGAKILADRMKKMLMETFFKQEQDVVQVGSEVAKIVAIAAAQKTASSSMISAYAAEAGAAGVQSAAAIPLIGWSLAPAAGAMDYAAAMAYQGMSMLSAEGGAWNIPSDQLAMVHKNESILPAHIAAPLRDMVEGGGGGGVTNISISAIDARSIREFFKANSHNLAYGVKQMARNFSPVR